MAMFNSHVKLPEGKQPFGVYLSRVDIKPTRDPRPIDLGLPSKVPVFALWEIMSIPYTQKMQIEANY